MAQRVAAHGPSVRPCPFRDVLDDAAVSRVPEAMVSTFGNSGRIFEPVRRKGLPMSSPLGMTHSKQRGGFAQKMNEQSFKKKHW